MTKVILHSNLIQSMIVAYKQSTAFQAVMNCAYTGAMGASSCPTTPPQGGSWTAPGFVNSSYPSTMGTAQYELSGQGAGDPWGLFLQDIYGTRFTSYKVIDSLASH